MSGEGVLPAQCEGITWHDEPAAPTSGPACTGEPETELLPLTGDEKLTLQRIAIVADAGFVPNPVDAHIKDLRNLLVLVERIRKRTMV